MSKTKKPLTKEEVIREREAPAHKSRREAHRKIEKFLGPIDEGTWEDEELSNFEPIKRKAK